MITDRSAATYRHLHAAHALHDYEDILVSGAWLAYLQRRSLSRGGGGGGGGGRGVKVPKVGIS